MHSFASHFNYRVMAHQTMIQRLVEVRSTRSCLQRTKKPFFSAGTISLPYVNNARHDLVALRQRRNASLAVVLCGGAGVNSWAPGCDNAAAGDAQPALVQHTRRAAGHSRTGVVCHATSLGCDKPVP